MAWRSDEDLTKLIDERITIAIDAFREELEKARNKRAADKWMNEYHSLNKGRPR